MESNSFAGTEVFNNVVYGTDSKLQEVIVIEFQLQQSEFGCGNNDSVKAN